MNDRFQSALDRHTGCSQYFNKQLQEGRRQITSSLSFNGAAGQQVLDEKNMVKGTTKHQQAAIPPCVSDLMSAIFYGATQELTVGQSFVFSVADAMRTINVTMKVEARERVITPAGTFDTIRVQPMARCRRGEESRQHLDLVYRRRSPHPGADACPAVLGHDHAAAIELRSEVTLLDAEAFTHQPLQTRFVDQVVGEFFVGKHGQGRFFCCRRSSLRLRRRSGCDPD